MPESYCADQLIKNCQDNWPEAHNPVHEFIVYFNRVHDLGFTLKARKIAQSLANLSAAEFDILSTLRCSKPPYVLTPTELQNSLLLTSGGVTKLLHQLEGRQLVSRCVVEEDKRSKLVCLTGDGKKIIEQTMAQIQKSTYEWLGEALTKRELAQLIKYLGKVSTVLKTCCEP
ncbi:MarR family transcriptional regulator [bacterium AH-315-K03]|nr:MarR family transcriptional regulator [bacterium AH-315-K03]